MRWLRALGAVVLVAALSASSAVAAPLATLSPASASFTLAPGGTATEAKTVTVPAKPPKADIEIAIDTTGSMTPSIGQAKADALNIVSGVQASVRDTQFAVVQFRDSFDSPEYEVVQAMTASAAAVQTAVNGLSAGGGGDAPEAYNLVFRNSYTPATGGPIGWRTGSRKFVIVIGDAEPHGAGAAGIAGCADATADPHGLNTATELAGMAANQRTLLMIRQVSSQTSTSLACYQSLAAATPGGTAVDGGGSLADQIVSLINAAFASVGDVHLEVASAGPAPANASWIAFSPASVGPVTPLPATVNFTVNISVPAATPPGTYSFDIVALADGADIGHQALTIRVNSPPDCTGIKLDQTVLWPPDHKMVPITASGATDPDGDAVTLVVTGVTQDEPVNGLGDGDTSPDAQLTAPPSNKVSLRAERSGTADGRVYRVHLVATDAFGATCTADRAVGVPRDQGKNQDLDPIDSAPPSYDSLLP